MVHLEEVLFERVLAVNLVHQLSVLAAFRVNVHCLRNWPVELENGWLFVVVGGKDLGKGVLHFQFAVDGATEEGFFWI